MNRRKLLDTAGYNNMLQPIDQREVVWARYWSRAKKEFDHNRP